MQTQCEMVYEHLKHAPITALEAYTEYGIMRLGARIYDLRQQGIEIDSVSVKAPTRSGHTTITRYALRKEKK